MIDDATTREPERPSPVGIVRRCWLWLLAFAGFVLAAAAAPAGEYAVVCLGPDGVEEWRKDSRTVYDKKHPEYQAFAKAGGRQETFFVRVVNGMMEESWRTGGTAGLLGICQAMVKD